MIGYWYEIWNIIPKTIQENIKINEMKNNTPNFEMNKAEFENGVEFSIAEKLTLLLFQTNSLP